MTDQPSLYDLERTTEFVSRHVGVAEGVAEQRMLDAVGYASLDDLLADAIPASIREKLALALPPAATEAEVAAELRDLASRNRVTTSMIALGYYDTITPPVIRRNVLENPGWYTQYTPYQAEISQGRLEALINFQTVVEDLTALPLANASLLDEATAAAEAMHMCIERASGEPVGKGAREGIDRAVTGRRVVWPQAETHPQTLAVMATRAEPLGISLRVGTAEEIERGLGADVAGILLSYPTTDGLVRDPRALIEKARAAGAA